MVAAKKGATNSEKRATPAEPTEASSGPLRVADIVIGENEDGEFRSSQHNELQATVVVTGSGDDDPIPNDAPVARVAFLGWVESGGDYFEFLYEESFIPLTKGKEAGEHQIKLPCWLPKFPPTIKLDKFAVNYACRATVNEWHHNDFIEKPFTVHRELKIAPDDPASFAYVRQLNETVGGGCCGGKQVELYTRVKIPKRAYSAGEVITVDIEIRTDPHVEIKSTKAELVQALAYRAPSKSNVMNMQYQLNTIAMHSQAGGGGHFELQLPQSDMTPTMFMTIWNVMTAVYELRLEVQAAKGDPAVAKVPIVIVSEAVEANEAPQVVVEDMEGGVEEAAEESAEGGQDGVNPNVNTQLDEIPKRSRDVDDDSDDDDDDDTDDDDDDKEPYEIKKFEVIKSTEGTLADSHVEVVVGLEEPGPITGVRLLFTGECNVKGGPASGWYEFLRYKAVINVPEPFEEGEHTFTVPLPFTGDQNEYDAPRMPPTLDDNKATIKYQCRLSTKPWTKNKFEANDFVFAKEVDINEDPVMAQPYDESVDNNGTKARIQLPQKAFQRGKPLYASVETSADGGKIKKVDVYLKRFTELRQPKLGKHEVTRHEEIVAKARNKKSPPEKTYKLDIPDDCPPTMFWCYWNVINIWYEFGVIVEGPNGTIQHVVPVDIGNTGAPEEDGDDQNGGGNPYGDDKDDNNDGDKEDKEDKKDTVPVSNPNKKKDKKDDKKKEPRQESSKTRSTRVNSNASEASWVGRLNNDMYKDV